jgi:hypothetical protein
MNSRPTRPSLTELEGRAVPARLNVVFDFRFDDTEFFTDHPDRINVLRAAASDIADRFDIDLNAIPFPTPGNSWKAKFDRPSGVGQDEEVINLFVPENSVVVFVGARELVGNDLIQVSSDREVFGSAEWNDTVLGRGRPSAFGPAATAFSPWGGSIAFDQFNNWHFGLEPPGNPDEFDLYMAAQNGLMHILGFGASEAFARLSTSGSFAGPNASAVFGGPVPLTDGRFEWVEDTLSRGQRTPMDADFEDGERVVLTELDLAAMQDIGWARVGTPPPPAPPGSATEAPPTVPPVAVPAGLAMLAFGAGAGAGANSAVTFNEATTLTRVIQFNPFDPSFTGGARVATGDVNGDGAGDIAVSPDQGGGPRVRIFSGRDGGQLADYFGIDDPNFRGGARATFGDVNGDGTLDMIVAAGFGGGPRVTVWDGKSVLAGSPRQIANFFMFEDSLRNGVFITAGDLNGDGAAEVIGGGGPGGGPRVLALNGRELITSGNQVGLANFFAGDPNNRGGVPVGVDDPDKDRRVDLVTGAGSGAPPVVTTYRGEDLIGASSPSPIKQFRIFDPAFTGGVFVG